MLELAPSQLNAIHSIATFEPQFDTLYLLRGNEWFYWAVVVAQLVEQLLLTPEIHGSSQVIGNFYLLSTVLKREQWGQKEAVSFFPFDYFASASFSQTSIYSNTRLKYAIWKAYYIIFTLLESRLHILRHLYVNCLSHWWTFYVRSTMASKASVSMQYTTRYNQHTHSWTNNLSLPPLKPVKVQFFRSHPTTLHLPLSLTHSHHNGFHSKILITEKSTFNHHSLFLLIVVSGWLHRSIHFSGSHILQVSML